MKCEDCINFFIETFGDGYHEPREIEGRCKYDNHKNEDTQEMVYNALENDNPKDCTLFNMGECTICGAKIKNKVYWVYGLYDNYRCCSKKCKEDGIALEKNTNYMLR